MENLQYLEEKEIELMQMLTAKENRVAKQRQLLEKYCKTVLAFTMNIAGPIKNNRVIAEAFNRGYEDVVKQLEESGIVIEYKVLEQLITGPEAYYVIDAAPLVVKKITTKIEEEHPIGRWFDLDVLTKEGNSISRTEMGFEPRRCLLCNENAKVCGRSRAHSVQEIQDVTMKQFTVYINKN